MKVLLTSSAFLGGLGIILGAFGAHSLKERLSAQMLEVFETGVRYQMISIMAIMIFCLIAAQFKLPGLVKSSYFILIGSILFSGSLYLLSCKSILGIENMTTILGPITPLGGLIMIIGWTWAAIIIAKSSISAV